MKVLYVGHDQYEPSEYCAGSTVCMALVEKLSNPIRVQNCDILRRHQELPDWLDGTPILIDEEDQHPLRGTQAVRYLQACLRREEKMQMERAQAPPVTQQQHVATRPMSHAPRMQPAQTRQQKPDAPSNPEMVVESAMLDSEQIDTAQDATANGAGMENIPLGTGKVDDNDLQRFMEARKNSPASAGASAQV